MEALVLPLVRTSIPAAQLITTQNTLFHHRQTGMCGACDPSASLACSSPKAKQAVTPPCHPTGRMHSGWSTTLLLFFLAAAGTTHSSSQSHAAHSSRPLSKPQPPSNPSTSPHADCKSVAPLLASSLTLPDFDDVSLLQSTSSPPSRSLSAAAARAEAAAAAVAAEAEAARAAATTARLAAWGGDPPAACATADSHAFVTWDANASPPRCDPDVCDGATLTDLRDLDGKASVAQICAGPLYDSKRTRACLKDRPLLFLGDSTIHVSHDLAHTFETRAQPLPATCDVGSAACPSATSCACTHRKARSCLLPKP